MTNSLLKRLHFWVGGALSLCLLVFATSSIQAQTVTICSQTAGGWNISAGTDAGQKLANTANFGPGGAICDFEFDFAVVGDGFTEATIDAAGCQIWWSGFEADGTYSVNELAELKSWIDKGGKVIAGCDAPSHDPVCELLNLELSGFPSGGSGVSNINVDLRDACFPNVDDTPILNGGGALDAFSEATSSKHIVVSRLVSNVNGVEGLNGLATAIYGNGIFATSDVNMFTGVGCCLTNGPELTEPNDFFLGEAVCVLAKAANDEGDCIEESASCSGQLICRGQINVNLQEDCEATLTTESAIPGFTCPATVVIEDGVGADNIVNGCGTYKFVVTDNNDPNNNCWGYITAEDKEAPVIEDCPTTVSGWTAVGYDYQEFVCDDVEELLFSGPETYKLDKDGNLIAGSFSSHHAEWILTGVTGYAEFTDNCGDITVTVTDEIAYGDDKDCDDVIITRKFVAEDACKGLVSEACYQDIVITKPSLKDVYCPDDAFLDCEDDVKLDANGNPHPDETGYPYVYQAFDLTTDEKDGKGVGYLDATYCNLGASYTDGERITVCEGTYKIVRTWEILDWC